MKKETVIYTLYYSYQSRDTQFDRKYKEFSSQFIDEIKQIAKVVFEVCKGAKIAKTYKSTQQPRLNISYCKVEITIYVNI